MSRLITVNRAGAILIELTAATGGAIVPLYHVGSSSGATAMKADPNYRGMIGLLNNLRAIATITSITEVDLPNFQNSDSDSDRMVKALDIQWKSPRKQINILQSLDGVTWVQTGAVSLLNSSGYPYTTHNILNFLTEDVAREFPDGHRLALQIVDVGTGLLGAGDRIVIDGGYVEEFTLAEPMSSIGQLVAPDLTSVETELLTVKNAIAAVAGEVGLIKIDLADDPEMSDINALSAKIDQILLELPIIGGGTDLTEVNTKLDSLAIEVAAVKSDLANDAEMSDINALSAKLDQLLAGGNVRANSSNESNVSVGVTSVQIIAADATGNRISTLINNTGAVAVYVRTGSTAATTSFFTTIIQPGTWAELSTSEAIQAITATSSTIVVLTEFLK